MLLQFTVNREIFVIREWTTNTPILRMQCFIKIQEVSSHVVCNVLMMYVVCWFIYNETSKQCFGVHHMDNEVQTSKESTALSNTTHYRKGKRTFRRHNIFLIKQNLS